MFQTICFKIVRQAQWNETKCCLQETFSNICGVQYNLEDSFFDGTSELAKDFIRSLLVRNVKKRASVETALNHQWIAQQDKCARNEVITHQINIEHFKRQNARQRWAHSLRVVCLCNRLSQGLLSRNSSSMSLKEMENRVNNTNNIFKTKVPDENFVMHALFCATEDGNLDGITELLEMTSNLDISQGNKHGETILHVAAGAGHTNVIKYLKLKGAAVNALDERGDSAIYWAARQGQIDTLLMLREEGLSLDMQNKVGETALHVAVRYGHSAVVEFLCQNEADLDLPDEAGETALHIAVWHGFIRIVQVSYFWQHFQLHVYFIRVDTA